MRFYLKTWFILTLVVLTTTLFFGIFFLSNVSTELELMTAQSQTPSQVSKSQINLKESSFLGFSDKAPSRGNPKAKIKIVEFSDFQCPFCREEYIILTKLLSKHKNDLYFQYRHFPLKIHPLAQSTAEASMCAYDQGKFWEYHSLIFENQSRLNEEFLLTVAKTLNLDLNIFDTCVKTKKYSTFVEQDFNEGLKLGVKATPTFFINNRKIQGVLPDEVWEKVIKELK